jgi:dGTPase
MINDICDNSSPEAGIRLSDKFFEQMNTIKKFNTQYIYLNKKFDTFRNYTELIINEIFKILLAAYDKQNTLCELEIRKRIYPELIGEFSKWLACYCAIDSKSEQSTDNKYKNKKIYGKLETKELYIRAILDYISGMTDAYAIKVFNDLLIY